MTPLIELRNVFKTYCIGDNIIRAVDGISVSIYKGEFVAFVGQSGSGKSTCMNIIGCLDIPTSGQYLLDGNDVGKLKDDALSEIRNQMIGFIFQQYNLLSKLNVQENVELSMLYAGYPRKAREERSIKALKRVGLSNKLRNKPSQLSGGQQQRVSIARALAGGPSVILADEPTGALDSKTGRDVLHLLQDLHHDGNTIVLITHDNSIAEKADRIIRLEDGKIVFDGPSNTRGACVLPENDEAAEK